MQEVPLPTLFMPVWSNDELFLLNWVAGYPLGIQLIMSCEDHEEFIFDQKKTRLLTENWFSEAHYFPLSCFASRGWGWLTDWQVLWLGLLTPVGFRQNQPLTCPCCILILKSMTTYTAKLSNFAAYMKMAQRRLKSSKGEKTTEWRLIYFSHVA